MGTARLAAAHLRQEADEAIAASGNQTREACSDRVACERQVQASFESERISRGQLRKHRTELMFFASERSVERLVVSLRRVEDREDFGLEGNRGPGHLRLDGVGVCVIYRCQRARVPAACGFRSVVLHGNVVGTPRLKLRENLNDLILLRFY